MAKVHTVITVSVVKLNKDGSREDVSHLLDRPCDYKTRKIRKAKNV